MTAESLSLHDNLQDLIRLRKRFRFRTARPLEECARLLRDMDQAGGCIRPPISSTINLGDEVCDFKIEIFGGKGMPSSVAIGTITKINNDISQIQGYVRIGYAILIFDLVGSIIIFSALFAVPEQLMSIDCGTLFLAAVIIFVWWYPIRDFRRLDKLIWLKLFEPASLIQ